MPILFGALLLVISHHLAGRVMVSSCDLRDFGHSLHQWSRSAQAMLEQCEQLGVGTRCLPVYYVCIVLDTERTVRGVLRFLGLPFSDTVLHHQDFVAAAGAVGDASHDHKVILSKFFSSVLTFLNFARIFCTIFSYNTRILLFV